MAQDMTHEAMLAALDYQIAMGADLCIADAPLDRYALSAQEAERKREAAAASHAPHAPGGPMPAPSVPAVPKPDVVEQARTAAGGAETLEDLRAALAAYEHCELKMAARSLVFSDGGPQARVMILGEAPGRDEDIQGKPFVGRAGHLLDRMFAAIGLARSAPDPSQALYITNVLPWRPPQNREPTPEEIAMMTPFVERHIALAAPDLLVLMGNIACQAMLERRGITRLRGNWVEVCGLPALPMFHPAFLLRNPAAKRESWADLLQIQKRLRETGA